MRRNQRRLFSCAVVLLMIKFVGLYYFMDFMDFCTNPIIVGGGDADTTHKYTITIDMSEVMSGEVHLKQDDRRLVKCILKMGLLEPPSKLAYNLTNPNQRSLEQPPMMVIQRVLREFNISRGFFVEYGVYDGEDLSISLYMERQLGWKVITVKYSHSPDKNQMLEFMKNKGYVESRDRKSQVPKGFEESLFVCT